MEYLFDVDGTLTPVQQNMPDEFKEFFLDFSGKNKVYLVSGATYSRLSTQLGTELLEGVNAVYSNDGSVKTVHGDIIYSHKWEPSVYLMQFLKTLLTNTKWKGVSGEKFNYLDDRLSYTMVCHNANEEVREEYYIWDKKETEREIICDLINDCYPDVTATIGNKISIDIAPKGIDKSQILDDKDVFCGCTSLRFFTDTPWEGNSDYYLASRIGEEGKGKTSTVQGWQHTQRLLKELYDGTFVAPFFGNRMTR